MDKEQYEVRYTLCIPGYLHEKIKEMAETEGVSMHQFMIYALARQVWDPNSTGKIQPAPPVEDQRRQSQELRRFLQSHPSKDEMQAWLDRYKPVSEQASPQDNEPVEFLNDPAEDIYTLSDGKPFNKD